MGGGLGCWVRSEWRNTWRSLLGVALLIALGGGVTIAAVGGARRADSAVDRFLATSGGAIAITASPVEPPVDGTVWDQLPTELAAIPGVDGVTPVAWMAAALQVEGSPGFFFAPALGIGEGADPPATSIVIEGRAAADDAADEVALNERAAELTGASLGDVIELRTYAADQYEEFVVGDGADDHGPRVALEVVGVVRGAEDIANNPEPSAFVSDAFREAHRESVASCDCMLLVNADEGDVDGVVDALTAAVADDGLVVEDLHSVMRDRVDHAVGLEVGTLWLAAAVALVAALLIAVQSIVRFIGGRRRAVAVLSHLGATRSAVVVAWMTILLPATIVGALGAGALAVGLSPLFPRGLARRAELDTGIRVDSVAIGVGVLAIIAVGTCAVLCVAASSSRSIRPSSRTSARSPMSAWAATLRPPAALGVNLAVNPSRDRSRVDAVTAVVGLAIAIGGVLAVGVIESSTADVLRIPDAFGADWDLEILENPEDPEATIGATLAEPIEAFALRMVVSGSDFSVTGPGGTGLAQPIAFEQLVGAIGPFIDSGRPLSVDDDGVLGAALASEIGAEVGDEVVLEPGGHTFRVAGIGRINDGDDTDQAMVVTMGGLVRLLADPTDSPDMDGGFVRVDADDPVTMQRLLDLGWSAATPPSKVANLSQIGSVPRLLAMSLVVLGLAGAVHALLVAVSARRVDLAIARALGFTPRQARATIAWQGIATMIAAVVVGIPLGILIGRVVWKQVTLGVGAVDLVSVPWGIFIVAPVAGLASVTLAGLIVGRRAAALEPGAVLRSE